jgi:hypothetical protein
MRYVYIVVIAVALTASLMMAVAAQEQDGTRTLQQEVGGYYGCTDTYLEDSSSADHRNFGIDNDPNDWTQYRNLEVRYSTVSYSQWVSLIKFDLSSLPRNWNITSASLGMYAWDESNMGIHDWLTVAIYPLLKTWDEGVGPHAGDERTGAAWYYRFASPNDTNWYNGGARGADQDRDAAYDAATTYYHDVGAGWMTWSGTNVTNTVREWYSGSRANNGWQVDATACSDTCNGLFFHNSEFSISSPDFAYRPKLTISYTITPEPTSLIALAAGLAGIAATRRKKA